jgi:hypothetical protein
LVANTWHPAYCYTYICTTFSQLPVEPRLYFEHCKVQTVSCTRRCTHTHVQIWCFRLDHACVQLISAGPSLHTYAFRAYCVTGATSSTSSTVPLSSVHTLMPSGCIYLRALLVVPLLPTSSRTALVYRSSQPALVYCMCKFGELPFGPRLRAANSAYVHRSRS